MGSVSSDARRRRLRHVAPTLAVAALAMLMLAALAAGAAAAPLSPTLSLDRLQAMLDASPSGTVAASFKTVIKGHAVVDIPCTLEGVVPGQAVDGGPLILLTATGPVIDQLGGIAAGMSGSPVYVDDAGTLKLVGAVSYGTYYATNGFGMATPIESMTPLEGFVPAASAGPRAVKLRRSTHAGGHAVREIVVTSSRTAAHAVPPRAGRAVMVPLSVIQVGGIPKDSPMFRALREQMAAVGIDVEARQLAASTSAAGGAFSTDLVPGAAVASLLTRGDPSGPDYLGWQFSTGAVGTVTYTTADGKLVAFGHPFLNSGKTDVYMANADVLKTVPNLAEPFKIAVPGAVRGTFSQDGGPGIAGTIGAIANEVPIKANVTNTATGSVVHTTTYMTRWAASQLKYAGLTAACVWPALWHAGGSSSFNGTIDYTLTIKVSDGTTEHTLVRSNSWDDPSDATTILYLEIGMTMMRLTADVDGLASTSIESLTLDATMSPAHNRARIADFSVDRGLKTGDNTVHVHLWPWGTDTTQDLDVKLDLPEGTPLSGTLYVWAPYLGIDAGNGWIGYWNPIDPNPDHRQTIDEVIAGIEALPNMRDLQVVYDPDGDQPISWWLAPWGPRASMQSVPTSEFLLGQKTKHTSRIEMRTPGVVRRGSSLTLHGVLAANLQGGTTVRILARPAGQKLDVVIASAVPVEQLDSQGPSSFTFRIAHLRKATRFTVEWDGDRANLSTSQAIRVKVR